MVSLAEWRARPAWERAAAHLNGAGLAAAVPPEVAPWLAARGYVVWAAAS